MRWENFGKYRLANADCLEAMSGIPDGTVDLILCDLPYGTTACKWDSIIPFEPLWAHYKRVIKPNGAIVLTASQPFTSALVMSNVKWFKYCWVWEKEQGSMPMNAPYQPIKNHEDIVVFSGMASTFSKKGTMAYYPQMTQGNPYKASTRKQGNMVFHADPSGDHFKDNQGTRYPKTVQFIPTERGLHPTQKPVALMEYMINTYTLPGAVILDNCMGSGTTGVACMNLNRRFIGIEKDVTYYELAKNRIAGSVKHENPS